MDQSVRASPKRPRETVAGSHVVGVTFHAAGSILDYHTGELALVSGDQVVVETNRGPALGIVTARSKNTNVPTGGLARVLRKADQRDRARDETNKRRQHDARRLCLRFIHDRELAMKLVSVAYQLDARKAVFYFCAEGRVDFRGLVRDLAQALHTRIEMKQIGARDETKLLGNLGPCGRELCCSTWLREFHAVSVKMAKEQGLPLNQSKLSGMCGRLKCCLRYEYDTYLELRRGLPGVGASVTSVKGNGEVTRQNILQQTALIRRQDDGVEVEVTLEDLIEERAD